MKQDFGTITNLKIPDFSFLFKNYEIRMHQAFILEVERDRVESTFSAFFYTG